LGLAQGPLEPDQALKKRALGPSHAVCPEVEKPIFEQSAARQTVALNRRTGRKTKTARAYRRESALNRQPEDEIEKKSAAL